MEDGDPVAEPGPEAGHRLRRQADLGDEDDRRAAPVERRLDRGQVDLGLARAGDPVQERSRAAPRRRRRSRRRAPRPPAAARAAGGAARRRRRPSGCSGARRRFGAAGRDQPALLEPAQDLAVGADRGGQLGADISPAAQRLERRPLLDPEPLAAAQRRLAGRGDLGPQLDPGADPLARGPGPGRQDQLEAARGGRAVLARRSRGRAGPARAAPRPRAPRSARRAARRAARSARRARRRRRGSRCLPKGTRTTLPTSRSSIAAGRR